MPGGSGSGLNEGGVESSLRDFMRIYPHLPMITVDLFSREKSGRSRSLDMGLIRPAAISPALASSSLALPLGFEDLYDRRRDMDLRTLTGRNKSLALLLHSPVIL